MGKTLTNEDFCRAAKKLRCEVSAIKAVASVESGRAGFYDDGFPVILFERHLFRKFTQGRYNSTYPNLSGPPGNYGAAGRNQRNKFSQAFALNPDAAMKSCSWGKFQILGSNYAICGYSNVGAFVDAMKESEGRHLDAFVNFVIGNHLDRHLRNFDWAAFAKGYNGAGYRANRYDTKMAQAYARFANENIDCSQDSVTTPTIDSTPTPPAVPDNQTGQTPPDPPDGSSPSNQAVDPPPVVQPQDEVTKTQTTTAEGDTKETVQVTTKNEQDVNEPAKVSAAQYQGVGFVGALKRDFAAVGGGNLSFQMLQQYAQDASGWPPWVIGLITKLATIAIILGAAWLLFRLTHYVIWKIGDLWRQKIEANINSDVTRKNIEFN